MAEFGMRVSHAVVVPFRMHSSLHISLPAKAQAGDIANMLTWISQDESRRQHLAFETLKSTSLASTLDFMSALACTKPSLSRHIAEANAIVQTCVT